MPSNTQCSKHSSSQDRYLCKNGDCNVMCVKNKGEIKGQRYFKFCGPFVDTAAKIKYFAQMDKLQEIWPHEWDVLDLS